MHERLAGLVLTGRDVELKAVPRAGDDAAGERPFAERPALVRANAVEGVERAADIEQGDDSLAGDEFVAVAGSEFIF